MPRTTAPPMMGETPTTERPRRAEQPRMPGIATTVPIDTTGFDGASTMTSASAMASSTPGAGDGVLEPVHLEPERRQRRAIPRPPLLEVQIALAAGLVRDDDVRLGLLVGRRHQPRPRAASAR